MKKISLVIALLLSTAVVFSQGSEKRLVLIDTADVNYVELVKINFKEPVKSEKKLLTKAQSADFASRWNSSIYMGADKYRMLYYVYVVLKNGSKRQFTISGPKVQEQDWMTYDIGDKLYFDKLWAATK